MNHSSSLFRMKLSLMLSLMITLIIIKNTNLSAQNLLITDYKVPVSSARSFLIDLKGNYATVGSKLKTNKSNISGVYKSFYESLPYAYSFDYVGAYARNGRQNNYSNSIEGRVKKYIWTNHDFFGSVKFNALYFDIDKRPPVDMTIGWGFGRFINVTPLAKAVRIEDFLLNEGLLYDDLPAQTMIDFGQTIERESEFKNKYGDDVYKIRWYEEMTRLIRESGMLKEERVDAIGILRMDEVLFRQKVHDRFYGWDATLGTKIELLTSSRDIPRKNPAADITIRYSHPLSWRAQWNERFTANSPMGEDFIKAYDLSLHSDFTYEMTNRIDFALSHLILIKKYGQGFDAQKTNSLRISFVFFIENSVNFVTSMHLDKTSETALTNSFAIALNYRFF